MAHRQKILHAYHQLHRQALQAVQYSSPSRQTLRRLINTEFRLGKTEDFDPHRIQNTLEFLKGATQVRGLEHKIMKTLLHVWYFEGATKPTKDSGKQSKHTEIQIKKSAFVHMGVTLSMLNESMQMCLPNDPAKRLDMIDFL